MIILEVMQRIVELLMNGFAEFCIVKIYRKYGGNIMQNFPRVIYIITTNHLHVKNEIHFKFLCKKKLKIFIKIYSGSRE